MKYSLGISNFLEEISTLSHSIVFLYFFALIMRKAFLSLLAILWNSPFRCLYLSFSPLLFASLLFTGICPITSWQIDGETMETVTDFIFLGSQITADGDFSHEIKTLASWKKSYDQPR